MSNALTIEVFNLAEFQQTLADVPKEAYTFIKKEHRLLAKRTYKSFIRERMSGRPGINWGGHGRNAKKVGKNVLAIQKDKGTLDSMLVWFRISSFLAAHEFGHTFTPNQGAALAIPLPSQKSWLPHKPSSVVGMTGQHPFRIPNTNVLAINLGGKLIPLYTLHRSVTVPARLGFRSFMRAQVPEFKARTLDAVHRAIRVAIGKRLKAVSSFMQQAA